MLIKEQETKPQKKKAPERHRRGSPSRVFSKLRIAFPRITVKSRWRRLDEQFSFA